MLLFSNAISIMYIYLYQAYIMYFLNIYSKVIMSNGIKDTAFLNESETRNVVMVNKILDIYILPCCRSRVRSLAVLLHKSLHVWKRLCVRICNVN